MDVKGRMNRWKEHFKHELNVGKDIDEVLLCSIGAIQLKRAADFEPPPPISMTEVAAAIKYLKNHKAPGVDEIHAEIP